jgi:hypothetical protein
MSLLDSLRNNGATTIQKPVINTLSTSVPTCDQCGKVHPPLKMGEKCPLANSTTPDGKEINMNKFLVNLKNIVISQSQKKQIKDVNKLFDMVTVEVMKFLEKYKE